MRQDETAGRRALDRRGIAAVEFALVAPILVAAIAWAADCGMALWYKTEIETAVRSGLQYALKSPSDTAGMRSTVVGATALAGVSVAAPTVSCECHNGASALCTGSCADGFPVRTLVTLTASYAFAPLFPSLTVVASPVTASATFQVK